MGQRSPADIPENHDLLPPPAGTNEADLMLHYRPLLIGVGGDLITELDALTEFSAKASVALSLQRRDD